MTQTEDRDNGNDVARNLDRRRVMAWLFLFALGLRFLNLICLSNAPFFDYKIGDCAKYDTWAKEVAAGDWFGSEVFYQAPLYPYFLAVIYSTVGDNLFVVRLIQAAIASLSCCLLAGAVWDLFGKRAAIVAGIVLACYAPSLFLETLLQKSVLDLFFVCLIIWLTVRASRRVTLKNDLWLGIALGSLCLTRETAVALIPFFALRSLLVSWRPPRIKCANNHGLAQAHSSYNRVSLSTGSNRQCFPSLLAFTNFAVFLMGLALVLGPVIVRNYVVGGEFHLTTSQFGPNFFIGNNPDADGSYRPLVEGRGDAQFERADAVAIAENETGLKLTPGEVSRFYVDKSLAYIREQPWDWLRLMGRKVLLSFNDAEICDTEDQYVYAEYSLVLTVMQSVFRFSTVVLFGFIGLAGTWRRWRELWPLHMMLALFFATLIAFYVFSRYRFPVVPLLILFASPVASRLLESLSNFDRRTVIHRSVLAVRNNLSTTIAACLLGVVCFLPIVSVQVARSATYNNFAIQAMIRAEWDTAEIYVGKSLALNPSFAIAHNSLGVLERELGKIESAAASFRRAIEISPDYKTAQRNLEHLADDAAIKGTRIGRPPGR